ncbi:MAG TPA: hypothetical protein VN816_06680 [Acidimicrobiales bacterium]|nr:hypothetical protein [Acidimicrobiales bacterium]
MGQPPRRVLADRQGGLLRDDADPRVGSGITRSYLPGPWIYLAATLLALWKPVVSVALFAAIAGFYMLESAFFGRRETASTNRAVRDERRR